MAKEDFCFTYYDGDAARDKAHMSRLERGAYDDIISAQRKRGHLSIDDLKKVLSKDFDSCWPALEWVLLKDEEGKYYIEWVEESITKMKGHKKKQKDRIEKYWEDVKSGKKERKSNKTIKNDSTVHNRNGSGIYQLNTEGLTKAVPLGDVNGDEDGNESKEFGKFENLLIDVDLLVEKIIIDKNYRVQCEIAGYPPSKLDQWMYAFNRFLKFKGVTESNEPGWRLGFPAWMAYHDYQNGEDPDKYSPVKWAKQKKEDADKILKLNGNNHTKGIGKDKVHTTGHSGL